MTPLTLEDRIKTRAHELGFDLVGIAPAVEADGFARLREWLDRGYAGQMAYMHRHEEARRHPSSVFHEVKSVIMLGHRYGVVHPPAGDTLSGRVAAYAQGPDYHDLLRDKLNTLRDWLVDEVPGCDGRGVVDSAPLLERDFARRAGLGWFGKNTMLIHKKHGSFLFLAALLTNLTLRPDASHETSHCGSCTRCLDACPTNAFPAPGWLDARRCISYLTIELKSSIPEDLREGMGDWIFGCDVCQTVCPWNRNQLSQSALFPHQDELERIDLMELIQMDEVTFRTRFRGTPMLRAKRRGLIRNALIVLGNLGNQTTLSQLAKCQTDPDGLIREAAEWAIKQIERRIQVAGVEKLET